MGFGGAAGVAAAAGVAEAAGADAGVSAAIDVSALASRMLSKPMTWTVLLILFFVVLVFG